MYNFGTESYSTLSGITKHKSQITNAMKSLLNQSPHYASPPKININYAMTKTKQQPIYNISI